MLAEPQTTAPAALGAGRPTAQIADLLKRIDAALQELPHTESYLSRLIFNDGKVIGRLRSGSADVTTGRLERAAEALAREIGCRATISSTPTEADGHDHVTAARAAVATAEAVEGSPRPAAKPSRQDQIHQKEVEELGLIAMTVRSGALRRLIYKGLELKKEAEDLWAPHGAADALSCELRSRGAPAEELKAAELDDRATWAVWDAKRREVEEVAGEVANAPFGDLNDVLARARAAALLIGANGDEEGLPEHDQDVLVILRSYRAAIEEMIARSAEREAWDDTVARLREIDRRIATMDTGENDTDRVTKAYADRAAAVTDLLTMQPPDLDGLLVFMKVVFEHEGPGVETYASRTAAVQHAAVTAEDLQGGSDDGLSRGLALIAQHAARLRDLEKPRDWQEAMRDIGGLHPHARDAVHQAYEAGLDLADLKNIQLAGQPEENLPTLLFAGRDGQFWARPDSVWKGHMIARDGSLVMAADGGELVK